MKSSRLSLCAFIFLLLVAVIGTIPTKINHNIDVYFADDEPIYVIDQKMREFFPDDDLFIFLLEGKKLFEKEFLINLDNAAKEIQTIDDIDRVLSVVTVDQIQTTEDGFKTAPLIDVSEGLKDTALARKEKVLNDRFAAETLISKDGSSMALVVRPDNKVNTLTQLKIRQSVLEVLKTHKIHKMLKAVSGPGEMTFVQFDAMMTSLKLFVPLTVLFNLFFIMWLFPRKCAVIVSFVAMNIAISLPIGLLNLVGGELTMIHTMIPPLMGALFMALFIHLLNKIKYYSNLSFSSKERAIMARNDVTKPAIYTALTTMAGLGSLALSPIPPIQSFGLVAAFGVFVITFMLLLIIPPIFAKWDKEEAWKKNSKIDTAIIKFTKICSRLAIRNAGAVVLISVILLSLGMPYIKDVKTETDVFRFFNKDHRINVDTRAIEKNLSGIITLDILIQSDDLDTFKKPENLKYIIDLQKGLEKIGEVDLTSSMAEMVEDMHWAFNREASGYRKIPNEEDLITQYLFVYDGTDLYEFVNYDFNTTRISVNINVHEAGKIKEAIRKISEHIDTTNHPGLKIEISGFGPLYANLSNTVVITQVESLLFAVGVIFIFLLCVFKSLGSALICMIPNLSPIAIIFIFMGIFNIWLDVGTAMIASTVVGIAVDDTIHLYYAYNKRIKQGRGMVISLMRAYQHVGGAVVATTIILSCQFLIIALSDFIPTRNFGLLSSFGVVAALVFDLLVLPAVIVLLFKIKRTASPKN